MSRFILLPMQKCFHFPKKCSMECTYVDIGFLATSRAQTVQPSAVSYRPISASWVGSSDTVSNLERKLLMALNACQVENGKKGNSLSGNTSACSS